MNDMYGMVVSHRLLFGRELFGTQLLVRFSFDIKLGEDLVDLVFDTFDLVTHRQRLQLHVGHRLLLFGNLRLQLFNSLVIDRFLRRAFVVDDVRIRRGQR